MIIFKLVFVMFLDQLKLMKAQNYVKKTLEIVIDVFQTE